MSKKVATKEKPPLREGCVRTKREVAAHFGLSSCQLYHWRGLPVEEDGTYDLEKIRLWRQERAVRPVLERKGRILPTAKEIDANLKALVDAKKQVAELNRNSSEVAEVFRGGRVDVLAAAQAKMAALSRTILDSFSEEEIKAMKPADRTRLLYVVNLTLAINYDKERLESDQSTENIAVVVDLIRKMKRERKGLPPKED
jgi:hypothetical protein